MLRRKFGRKSFVKKNNFGLTHGFASLGTHFNGRIVRMSPKKKKIEASWSRFERDLALYASVFQSMELPMKNKLRMPHARGLPWRIHLAVDFNRRQRDILSARAGVGRILTRFIVLTVTRARPPSIPCDVSYLSGVTLPPCWAAPSSTWWDFSRPLLKRRHFADGDGRVTAVSRHDDTRGRVKSDMRHVPTYLKLYHINSRSAGQIPRGEKGRFSFSVRHARLTRRCVHRIYDRVNFTVTSVRWSRRDERLLKIYYAK